MNETINIARGLAIIAMVLGHVLSKDNYWVCFIYKWHMPLFFLFSGFFFDAGKYNVFAFCKRKVKTLYVPFVFWSFLYLCFHNFFAQHGICATQVIDFSQFKTFAFRIFVRMQQFEPLLGTFWFLTQLLLVNLFAYGIAKLVALCKITHDKIVDFLLVVILCIGAVLLSKFNVTIYYQINYVTLLATAFFFSGKLFRKIQTLRYALFVVSGIILITCNNGFHEMIDLKYKDILVYYFVAIYGVIFIYNVSQLLSNCIYIKDFLAYIGKRSLSIMILHFSSFKIVSYLIVLHGEKSMSALSCHPVIPNVEGQWITAYIIIGIFLPLFLDRCYSSLKKLVVFRKVKL